MQALLTAKACTDDEVIIDAMNAGDHFGLLFQIIDDILDETGSLVITGKSPGKDAEQNKLTYVSLLGLSGAQKEAKIQRDLAIEKLKLLPCQFPELETIIDTIYEKGTVNAS